ncbi:MAG: hypothetical protein RL409_2447 [Gemmatimonadota bacterium]
MKLAIVPSESRVEFVPAPPKVDEAPAVETEPDDEDEDRDEDENE